MPLKIKVKTNVSFSALESGEVALPPGITTVGGLLRYLAQQKDFALIDPDSRKLETYFEILLNDKDIWFYPTGLDTSLKNGDSVHINLIPIGGG
jgi:molybdopterin converting factor small subunit